MPQDAYLLTSPGVFPLLGKNLACFVAVIAMISASQEARLLLTRIYDGIAYQMMEAAHSMAWWAVLALLSSSCCALQIILNAFSFGCAGFNTWLGPWRPVFLALTIITQSLVWSVAYYRPFQWRSMAASSAVTCSLALLPEALAGVHAYRARKSPAVANIAATKLVYFRFNTLGCISCATTVRHVLTNHPQVSDCSVSVEQQEAWVRSAHKEVQDLGLDLCSKLEDAGFPASHHLQPRVEQTIQDKQ